MHILREFVASESMMIRGGSHAINVSVLTPSELRMYIEPHYVDLDIWVTPSLAGGKSVCNQNIILLVTISKSGIHLSYIILVHC